MSNPDSSTSIPDDRERSRRARLARITEPASTAVITMELQNGVVGPEAMMVALVEEVARAGTVDAAGQVCRTARTVGAQVVHCTAELRADGLGVTENCKIFAMGEKLRRETGTVATAVGTPGADPVAGLGHEPADIVVARMHGLTPFMSTSLDQMLRNVGISTVVVTGVSVNLGVLGLCINAVDLGYRVVLVRDAVAGVPTDYADAVIDNTLSLLATITTADELCSIWASTDAVDEAEGTD